MRRLITGRAMITTVQWHASLVIAILNVYAPNAPQENESFWKNVLTEARKPGIPKIDVMMGDFNLVEDAIDQLPSKHDNEYILEGLRNLKSSL